MKSILKTLSMCVLVAVGLSGCSMSAISTHGLADNTYTHSVREDRDDYVDHHKPHYGPPRSNHVSRRGDQSADLLVQGQDHFAEQNYGLAEKAFRQAVEIRSDNANAWMGLAASLDQLGRFEYADRAYSNLRALKGDDPRILNNLGYSYLLRGDYKKARAYFNQAQTADPLLEEVQGNIHLLEKVASS